MVDWTGSRKRFERGREEDERGKEIDRGWTFTFFYLLMSWEKLLRRLRKKFHSRLFPHLWNSLTSSLMWKKRATPSPSILLFICSRLPAVFMYIDPPAIITPFPCQHLLPPPTWLLFHSFISSTYLSHFPSPSLSVSPSRHLAIP